MLSLLKSRAILDIHWTTLQTVLQIEVVMVRVTIRTYFYDEYGGVGNDIFVKDVETLDMAKEYV